MGSKTNALVHSKLLLIVNLHYKIVRDITVIISCICIHNLSWASNDIFSVKKNTNPQMHVD